VPASPRDHGRPSTSRSASTAPATSSTRRRRRASATACASCSARRRRPARGAVGAGRHGTLPARAHARPRGPQVRFLPCLSGMVGDPLAAACLPVRHLPLLRRRVPGLRLRSGGGSARGRLVLDLLVAEGLGCSENDCVLSECFLSFKEQNKQRQLLQNILKYISDLLLDLPPFPTFQVPTNHLRLDLYDAWVL
jgi:hypothetical protein